MELRASSNILSGIIFSAISGSSTSFAASTFLSFCRGSVLSSSIKNGIESRPPDLLFSPLNVLECLFPDSFELLFLFSSLGREFLFFIGLDKTTIS